MKSHLTIDEVARRTGKSLQGSHQGTTEESRGSGKQYLHDETLVS